VEALDQGGDVGDRCINGFVGGRLSKRDDSAVCLDGLTDAGSTDRGIVDSGEPPGDLDLHISV
jgi:hypothetical protein